jgi:hypothetical protein
MTTSTQHPSTPSTFQIEVFWMRIKRTKDFVKRAEFREALGNPANETFYKWMRSPGKIPVSNAISLAKWLSKEFKSEIEATDLVKPLA